MRSKHFLCWLLAVLILSGSLLSNLSLKGVFAAEPEEPDVQAAYVYEQNSGLVLYAYNADTRLSPASTTKVMTALLVLEAVERGELSLDERYTATAAILTGLTNASVLGIKAGEKMRLYDILCAMLIASACDAANWLALIAGGTIPDFVNAMNNRAVELDCLDTQFKNPHGLRTDGHYSTARDISVIFREALKFDSFREITSYATYELPATNYTAARMLENTNSLINPEGKFYYEYCLGGKTGSLGRDYACLVSRCVLEGVDLICCTLGGKTTGDYEKPETLEDTRFEAQRALCDWAFARFAYVNVLCTDEPAITVDVTNGALPTVDLYPLENLAVLIDADQPAEMNYQFLFYEEELVAPIEAGMDYGKVLVYKDGELIGTEPLVAGASIEYVEPAPVREPLSLGAKLFLGLLAFCLLFFLLGLLLTQRQKKKAKKAAKKKAPIKTEDGEECVDVFDMDV